jgi:hypothetical protein
LVALRLEEETGLGGRHFGMRPTVVIIIVVIVVIAIVVVAVMIFC